MDSPYFWWAFLGSLLATALCWLRIFRSDDSQFFRVTELIISAIPFLGPLFFLIIDLPPSLPPYARAKFRPTVGGCTSHEQATEELYKGYKMYLNSLPAYYVRRRKWERKNAALQGNYHDKA